MGEGVEGRADVLEDESIATPRLGWVMLAVLFGCGATIGAQSMSRPHPEAVIDEALWSNIALAYAGAVICLVGVRRWGIAGIYAMVGLGVLAVTRAAYYSHDPSGFYSLFYVWIGLYAVFFFR